MCSVVQDIDLYIYVYIYIYNMRVRSHIIYNVTEEFFIYRFAVFGAISCRRCVRRDIDGCVVVIGPDGQCDVAGRGPVAG